MIKIKRIKKQNIEIFIIAFLVLMFVSLFFLYDLFEFEGLRKSTPEFDEIEPTTISEIDSDQQTTIAEPIEIESPVYGTDYLAEGGLLELPINGASGYASVSLSLHEDPSTESSVIRPLIAGEGFTILDESNEWWKIEIGKVIGWVMHKNCFINLPDVIPSIVYNNTNAYSSKIVSSGKEVPNVTGQKLYEAYTYNERINKVEFIMPVLYSMASKINEAQQTALADGNTLIIYEGFRPYAIQKKIVDSVVALVNSDQLVKEGITDSKWSIGWFIFNGISNHQRGYAIDVSLGKVLKQDLKISGTYIYKTIIEYTEYSMPSKIHELSVASIVYKSPVSSTSDTLWKEAELSDSINQEAKLLQKYLTEAGFTPLASEWWHFNDLESAGISSKVQSDGKYFIQDVYSKAPIVMINEP